MKKTHIGEVADLEHIVMSSDPSMQFSAHQMGFMLDYEDQEIELFKESDRCYTEVNTDFIFRSYMLTNLREIKPEVVIPETPFWFKDSIGDMYSVSVNKGQLWDYILYKNDKLHKGVDSLNIKSMLNNGTWTICDAPEKEDKLDSSSSVLLEGKFRVKKGNDNFNAGEIVEVVKDRDHRAPRVESIITGKIACINREKLEDITEKEASK